MAAHAKCGQPLAAALSEFLEREKIWREHFPARARMASCDGGARRLRASAALLLNRLGWDYVGDAQVHLFALPIRSGRPVVVFGGAHEQPEEEIGRVVQQAARLRALLRTCNLTAIQVRSLVVMSTEPSPNLLTAAAIAGVRLLAAEELARLSAEPVANSKSVDAMITATPTWRTGMAAEAQLSAICP